MVSIAEALQETEQAEESIVERRRRLDEIEATAGRLDVSGSLSSQIRAGSAPEFTRQRRARKKAKKETLGVVARERAATKGFEKQVAQRKSQIRSVQARQQQQQALARDIALAQSFADRDRFPFDESKRVRKLFTSELARQKAISQLAEQKKTFASQGLTPVFLDGQLAGFDSELTRTSFTLENLGIQQPSAIPTLEQAGLISVERIDQAPSLDVFDLLPPGAVAGIKQPPRRESVASLVLGRERTDRIIGSALDFSFGEATIAPPGLAKLVGREDAPIASVTFADIRSSLLGGIPEKRKKQAIDILTDFRLFTPTSLLPRDTRRTVSRVGVEGISLVGQVGGVLLPTSRAEIAAFAAFPGASKVIIKASPPLGRLTSFGLGATGIPSILDKEATLPERLAGGLVFTAGTAGGVLQPSKFQLGQRGQRAQIGALLERDIISQETAGALLEGVKLQKFFRGVKDPAITKGIQEIIPKEIPFQQRVVIEEFLLSEKPLVFGGKSLELRDIRSGSDIDVALANNKEALRLLAKDLGKVGSVDVRGEAIGTRGGEKLLDVKDIARLKDFPLSQPSVLTTEGIPTPRTSEQFSRSLSGVIGFGGEVFRKGGKDLPDVLNIGKVLLGESRSTLEGTRFPGLSLFRQARLSRAERSFSALEKATPEIESLTGLDVTIEGFKLTTPPVSLADVGKEFEKALPGGKGGRVGGFDIFETGRRPRRARVKPGRLQDTTSQFDFRASKIKTPKLNLTPSTFSLKGFDPSGFRTPTGRRGEPSAFDFPTRVRGTPRIIIKPTPSQFQPPPTTRGSFDFPGQPVLRPRDFRSFESDRKPPVKKKKGGGRQPLRRKISQRGQPFFPISPSFTAVTANVFGRFPRVRQRGLGLSPEQIRVQPIRRAPRRSSLAGVRTKRRKVVRRKKR